MARKQSHPRTLLRYMTVIFMALALTVFPAGSVIKNQKIPPLSSLPIPRRATINLPAPLTFPSYETSVLGAQTIDPKEIVEYINLERKKRGAKPLRMSRTLMTAAQMRADIILKYQNFSHQDPYEQVELTTVLPKLNYHFAYASENIGMGGLSGKDFVGGFMNSVSHRENLLNPYLSDTGAAVVTGPYKQYYVNIAVQIFAIPGGKEEMLGYSEAEVAAYQKALSEVNSRLLTATLLTYLDFSNRSYYQQWQELLRRQRTILTAVYTTMREQQPLKNEEVALIYEYNDNWSRSPSGVKI